MQDETGILKKNKNKKKKVECASKKNIQIISFIHINTHYIFYVHIIDSKLYVFLK